MDETVRLTSQQRDNLVAYLDGELDEDSTREIEQLLSQSPEARAEVEGLSDTWEMLETLPRMKPSQGFTERTMATIKVDSLSGQWRLSPWFQRVRRGAMVGVWCLGLGGAAALGYLAANQWVPNEADLLLEDFSVIQQLDVYQEVDSIEFLEALKNRGLFDDFNQDGESTND